MNRYPRLPAFQSYLRTLTAGQRRDFAERLGVTVQYLYQVHSGFRRASATMAANIERETSGQVARVQIRPDYFGPLEPAEPIKRKAS